MQMNVHPGQYSSGSECVLGGRRRRRDDDNDNDNGDDYDSSPPPPSSYYCYSSSSFAIAYTITKLVIFFHLRADRSASSCFERI